MSPTPLQHLTIALLLQYLFPPGATQIPPHLLSRPLLQRHHFLQISPDDAVDYLSWPSNDRAQAVSRLDASHAADDVQYHIRYSADIEYTYAHVHLPGREGGVRLVFLWQEDGWKYHDLGLMPFPTSSTSSVTELDTAGYHQPPQRGLWDERGHEENDDDESSYWDSYGTEDQDDSDRRSSFQNTEDNEDAYWNQYASVHGSGDSTHPSPPQTHRKLVKEVEEPPLLLSIPNASSRLSPPSPTSLAARLHSLSPRESFHSSYASSVVDIQDLRVNNEISPIEDEEESEDSDETPSPPSGLATHPPAQMAAAPADRNSALKLGIHGLYNLWLVGQTGTESDSERKRAFLELVKEAIQLP